MAAGAANPAQARKPSARLRPRFLYWLYPAVAVTTLSARPYVTSYAREVPGPVVERAPAPEALAAPAAPRAVKRWFRGNLHTHSLWSDGTDPPEVAVAWYRANGYHFVALTEHNMVPAEPVWRPVSQFTRLGRETLRYYLSGYALPDAEPTPIFPPAFETREGERGLELLLSPMSTLAKRFDRPEEFLVVSGEEITGAHGARPVHLNAIHLDAAVMPQSGPSVGDALNATLEALRAQEKRQGSPTLAVLNHPNFNWAFTPSHLAQARAAEFLEVMNGNPYTQSQGNAVHPPVEHLWDAANALRLTRYRYPPLQGIGVDDMHRTRGAGSTPGRAWTMVRAERLDARSLIEAMRRDDFYVSTGVVLEEVSYDAGARTLEIHVHREKDTTYTIEFIGVVDDSKLDSHLKEVEHAPALAGALVSQVLGRFEASSAAYRLEGAELFVRAVITSSRPHKTPSFRGQQEQAWTPVFAWRGEERRPKPG